jgi:CBS domain containing-hemolysin-like protein
LELISGKIVLIVMLLLISGFFSCSEAALFSLTSLHLHKMGEERYPFLASVRRLVEQPKRLLITLVVGNEVVNVALAITAASLFIGVFGTKGQWVAIGVTTVLLLIFGESIPKTFGVSFPMPLASIFAPVLGIIARLESPVVRTLDEIAGWLLRFFTKKEGTQVRSLSEDEFRTFVDVGQRGGVLEKAQRDLIHRVFELSDKNVAELMVPRVEMFCLPASMAFDDIVREVVQARHSRIPVYGTNQDDILGILFARDLLPVISEGKSPLALESLLRKPYFVPEEKKAGGLLKEFQERGIQIAIVVDEYGGVSGLVTLEDILEDLFEDIYEGLGVEEGAWLEVKDGSVLVPGSTATSTFNNRMGTDIPEGEFDTVGGFVFHLFGRLPATGDEIAYGNMKFKIEVMGRARILKIRVVRAQQEEDDG